MTKDMRTEMAQLAYNVLRQFTDGANTFNARISGNVKFGVRKCLLLAPAPSESQDTP